MKQYKALPMRDTLGYLTHNIHCGNTSATANLYNKRHNKSPFDITGDFSAYSRGRACPCPVTCTCPVTCSFVACASRPHATPFSHRVQAGKGQSQRLIPTRHTVERLHCVSCSAFHQIIQGGDYHHPPLVGVEF